MCSGLESYNGRLGTKIAGGSNFFKFAKLLIREEAVALKEFRQLLDSGGASKFTQRQTDRQVAIEQGTHLLLQGVYCTVYTPEDFLSRVSYSGGTQDLCQNWDISEISEEDKLPIGETAPVRCTNHISFSKQSRSQY